LPADDPKQRQSDISRAKEALGWEPHWQLEGLKRIIAYFKTANGKPATPRDCVYPKISSRLKRDLPDSPCGSSFALPLDTCTLRAKRRPWHDVRVTSAFLSIATA